MKLDEFDYVLPSELIAQHPPTERGASRMLTVDGATGSFRDGWFRDLPRLLEPNDLLVFNDTRVIRARLIGRKATGGRVEMLVERVLDDHHALVQLSASHTPREGSWLQFGGDLLVEVLSRHGEFFQVRFDSEAPVLDLLEQHGQLPLPPYIEREDEGDDATRYQTVYADKPGAVAAPTAGLHFSEPMLERIAQTGARSVFLTLHVGAGTFQPVRVDDVTEHRMHAERYQIGQDVVDAVVETKSKGGRVLAVGTTSLRALEAAAARTGTLEAGGGETNLFILPGFKFKVVDRLLTNFHLPKSTLLMLVSAFGGLDTIRRAYLHAVQERYRFFSYGDAMLIERA
ncbi:MAG: tRNA preQ1(34) S-adenosylmethionine ribosyltransferase-isomerase QueA [Burkholderiales bacterium]|nr:tRNA preQ1(34) S-adenosylmethionine ribosyltransferase-isomerase QueA [Burkholderiales bacterium]